MYIIVCQPACLTQSVNLSGFQKGRPVITLQQDPKALKVILDIAKQKEVLSPLLMSHVMSCFVKVI